MDAFPRQYARTRGFRLGAPRDITIAPDGQLITFLRSRAGDDPTMCLWAWESGAERLVVDSAELVGAEEPTEEERTRRERTRDYTSGMTSYATDRDLRLATFAISGRLWLTELDGKPRELPAQGPVADPRPSPDGSIVAYVSHGALRLINTDGTQDRELLRPEHADIRYGLPEHVAAEEMDRDRGFWWSPDGTRLLVARVDTSPVQRWYLADPANPDRPPTELAYPVVGTPNAEVTLWLVDHAGHRVEVRWDRAGYEYVTAVHWSSELLVVVQSRNQRSMRVLTVDPATGATALRREDTDEYWVDIILGTPALTGSGRLVSVAIVDGSRRLLIDGEPVTPDGLNVRRVCDVDGDTVLFAASTNPTETQLWTYAATLTQLTEHGVHDGWMTGGTTVIAAQSLDHDGPRVTVHRAGEPTAELTSLVEPSVIQPRVELITLGERELHAVVLFPSWHTPGSGKLPVLMDPYGGPAGQRVLASRTNYLVSQWFADQGFAVIVADGRGTPGRGPAWERTIYGDRAGLPLEDQIAALHAAAERYPDLDLTRVGIRGWSYGGYLSALAVLRAPDVFHAAVAGAPVTDHALYDTHFNERYLGDPNETPENYARCNIIPDAPNLRCPLMLIHGLADDNVVVAHTLRLSAALLAAGRPHTVLPLPGDSHMIHQQAVAENLLTVQADFLRNALGV